MRRLDQQDLIANLVWDVVQLKQPGIDKFEQKRGLFLERGGDAQLDFDFVDVAVELAGLQIDAEIDLRARRRARRGGGFSKDRSLTYWPTT